MLQSKKSGERRKQSVMMDHSGKATGGQRICSILLSFMRLISQKKNTTIGLIIVAAALVISWGILVGKVLAAQVTVSWSYDYGPMPACSAARTTECIDHFEVLDITDQKDVVMIQSVGNAESAVGKVDKISANFKYGPPFGHRTFSVIAVARDLNGDRITSDPHAARLTLFIRPFFRLLT